MNLPDPEDLMATVEATWPPASASRAGPWTIRDGQGGGKRVSAATANSPVGAGDLPEAEASMRALGQPELFMIRKGDEALDALLAQRGYKVIDPTDIYAAHVADLDLAPPPRLSVFSVWPPLAIQREVWATGGIGPGRVAVMERVSGPKTALLGRRSDRAVAAGFVAVDKGIAMIHAGAWRGP